MHQEEIFFSTGKLFFPYRIHKLKTCCLLIGYLNIMICWTNTCFETSWWCHQKLFKLKYILNSLSKSLDPINYLDPHFELYTINKFKFLEKILGNELDDEVIKIYLDKIVCWVFLQAFQLVDIHITTLFSLAQWTGINTLNYYFYIS